MNNNKEDTHFYLDFAPPEEVVAVLKVLSSECSLTTKEISNILKDSYGFEMQKDKTYSPRRLFDLGLAIQERKRKGSVVYRLSERGLKVQNILGVDSPLAMDLMHYLHYTGHNNEPHKRKYLWSYRKCCEIIWDNMRLIKYSVVASSIQSEMQERFPWLDYGKRAGARFDNTAASRVAQWLRVLEPTPIDQVGSPLILRTIDKFELALLALDEAYRSRSYTYGDPVIMDDEFIRQVSAVFFLDQDCCAALLKIGARINQNVKISDTLTGASINLLKPFKIEDM